MYSGTVMTSRAASELITRLPRIAKMTVMVAAVEVARSQ